MELWECRTHGDCGAPLNYCSMDHTCERVTPAFSFERAGTLGKTHTLSWPGASAFHLNRGMIVGGAHISERNTTGLAYLDFVGTESEAAGSRTAHVIPLDLVNGVVQKGPHSFFKAPSGSSDFAGDDWDTWARVAGNADLSAGDRVLIVSHQGSSVFFLDQFGEFPRWVSGTKPLWTVRPPLH